jgi:hypothetical protein
MFKITLQSFYQTVNSHLHDLPFRTSITSYNMSSPIMLVIEHFIVYKFPPILLHYLQIPWVLHVPSCNASDMVYFSLYIICIFFFCVMTNTFNLIDHYHHCRPTMAVLMRENHCLTWPLEHWCLCIYVSDWR